MFTNTKALRAPLFWRFVEASLHKPDSLNHWPLAFSSMDSLSSLHGDQGGKTSSYKHLITWLVLLIQTAYISCDPKVTLLTQQEASSSCSNFQLRNVKHYGSPKPETVTKTEYIFLSISHTMNFIYWKILSTL